MSPLQLSLSVCLTPVCPCTWQFKLSFVVIMWYVHWLPDSLQVYHPSEVLELIIPAVPCDTSGVQLLDNTGKLLHAYDLPQNANVALYAGNL